MKKLVLVAAIAATFTTACSKDEGPTNKCESCTIEGEKIEACDNGDGTVTVTAGDGSTTTFDEEFFEMLGVTSEQYLKSLCAGEPAL